MKKKRTGIVGKSDKGIQPRKAPTELTSPGISSLANNLYIHIAIVVFLILIIYSNTLSAPFQWDEAFIVNNPFIMDLNYNAKPSDAEGLRTLHTDFVNRYAGYLSFALNYKIHGFSVAGYHIFSIVIHIANAILVYLLVLLTFRTPLMADSPLKRRSRIIALLSSLIFAAHPLQTEAVTFIYQRLASLVAFFYLLSLTAYIESRTSQDKKRRILAYGIALTSSVLAMKTKENAFTLPVVIALFEFCFFKDPMKKRFLFLAPILVTLAIIPLTLMGYTGAPSHASTYTSGPVLSRGDYFFTQGRVIVTYLRLLFCPINQNLVYDYPAYRSFFDPQVLLSFMLLTTLFVFGVYLILKKDKNSGAPAPHFADLSAHRLIGFGIIWFFIALSVESSIIPLQQLIDEYRMYLPSVSLIICIVTGAFLLNEQFKFKPIFIIVPFILSITVLSIATYSRNELWKNEISLWEDIVKKSPRRALVHYNLGTKYTRYNMPEKAMEQYLIAVTLDPDYADAHNNLGNVYSEKRMFDKAIEQYQIVVRLNPNYALAHYNLAFLFQSNKMLSKAIEEYLTFIRLNPNDADAHNNLGNIFSELKMFDKAIDQYLFVINLKPDYPQGHYNLAYAYYKAGRREHAFKEVHEALKINPNDLNAQQLLKVLSQ